MVLPEHIAVAARDADIDTVRAWLATNDVNEVSIGGGDWGPRTLLQCASRVEREQCLTAARGRAEAAHATLMAKGMAVDLTELWH